MVDYENLRRYNWGRWSFANWSVIFLLLRLHRSVFRLGVTNHVIWQSRTDGKIQRKINIAKLIIFVCGGQRTHCSVKSHGQINQIFKENLLTLRWFTHIDVKSTASPHWIVYALYFNSHQELRNEKNISSDGKNIISKDARLLYIFNVSDIFKVKEYILCLLKNFPIIFWHNFMRLSAKEIRG